jgi:hypothetical protein
MTPEQLRRVRAVEVSERIASDEAKKLLRQWAAGAEGGRADRRSADRSRSVGPVGDQWARQAMNR